VEDCVAPGGLCWGPMVPLGSAACCGAAFCDYRLGSLPWIGSCQMTGHPTAELSSESPLGTCTPYSQCGGDHWSGCTQCPGQQVCQPKSDDPSGLTKVCVDPTAELSSESPLGTCTPYSQCGGDHWSGCTQCPGQQVCQPNSDDPSGLTKVCVDPAAELSSESPLGTCTPYSQCGGDHWSGCTQCPGQQVCQPNSDDPSGLTKVCVDPTAGLSSESPGGHPACYCPSRHKQCNKSPWYPQDHQCVCGEESSDWLSPAECAR
jgi:hypothetical protein